MRFIPKTLHQKITFALSALVLVPLPASALLINTSPAGFSNSASKTDAENGGASNNNGASLGTSTISRFNSNQGVLMGTTLHLTSTRTQSTWVRSTDGSGGTGSAVTSSGTGSSTASISGPGINATFSAITNSDTCTDKNKDACTGTATTSSATPTNLNQTVSSAHLDSYVGNGDVALAHTAPTLTATQGAGAFTGAETTEYTVTWAGNVGATYDYLLHAAPSFDGSSTMLTLNLDFGTFFVGDAATLGFSLFNLADANRVGLDLDSISGSGDGDFATLWTDLGTFSNLLDQGSSHHSWQAMLDTSSAGIFSASYILGLSDADVGAASSRAAYSLTLNLTGTVNNIPDPAAQIGEVSEPATLALLGLGLAGLGFSRRKKS